MNATTATDPLLAISFRLAPLKILAISFALLLKNFVVGIYYRAKISTITSEFSSYSRAARVSVIFRPEFYSLAEIFLRGKPNRGKC